MTTELGNRHLLAGDLLERALIVAAGALGLAQAWVGRYSMNPDGVSYLDVGDSFFRHEWSNAVSAWWSPLYPWTLGVVVGIAKPSPRWEFPLVQLVNFGFFLFALLAFRFLLHQLLTFRREQIQRAGTVDTDALPDWAALILGYAIFLWTALEGETIYDVSPDLAVMGCICFIAGMLLVVRHSPTLRNAAVFGAALGLGYWTKTVLFPLGCGTLVAAYWWRRSEPKWPACILLAGVVFSLISMPLIFLISQQKGRLTIGDSGKLNYAWYVSPRTFWRNWQGDEPESGVPLHPTRRLLRQPPTFEFGRPVAGTYPPWTDPSYWNDGLTGHFRLRSQIEVLSGTVPSELRLLLRAQPALVAGVLVFALFSGRIWWANMIELWPLTAISLAGMAVYLPLVENDRYLGGFLLLFYLVLVNATEVPTKDQRKAAYVALAVSIAMVLGTTDYMVRIITNHLAIPGSGPSSAFQDVVAAEQLWKLGARPDDKVAIIGDGTDAFWARLAKLRIVAEIMDANHGSREFWSASESKQQEVYAVFARAGAKLVVTTCPACPPGAPQGWVSIEGTPYCMRPL